MKLINLFGDTIAEKLRKLEISVNDLFSEMATLGWYVTKEGYVDDATTYNTSFITSPDVSETFLGRPIYFASSGILAVVNTYNGTSGQYTVTDSRSIKGDAGTNGTDGKNGNDGKNGIPNAFAQINPPNNWAITGYKNSQPVVGEYYVVQIISSANTNYKKGDIVIGLVEHINGSDIIFRPDTIRKITNLVGATGEQGRGITSVQAISHREENDETVTTCQAVFDSGAPSEFEVHAKNGSGQSTLYRHVTTAQRSGGGELRMYIYTIRSQEIRELTTLLSELNYAVGRILVTGNEYRTILNVNPSSAIFYTIGVNGDIQSYAVDGVLTDYVSVLGDGNGN